MTPAFADCALPDNCVCAKRGFQKWEHTRCLVPGINRTAMELGWTIPYETESLETLLHTVNGQ